MTSTVELPIAHTVVSDSGGSYGYSLVAASPGVTSEEADFLSAASGASDFLHTQKRLKRAFLSFFPLSTGRWALVRRFLHGTRRGGFHRVVTHTLVFDDAVLEALGWDPWLLHSASRFQERGSDREPGAWSRLEAWIGDPKLERVQDLVCLAPAAADEAAAEIAEERRGFLRDRWGDEALTERLAWIVAALLEGRRLILPQGPESEALLALAWSSLPGQDRLRCPWTTHFAPGVRVLFRLINADEPEQARRMHQPMEEWVVLGEGLVPGESETAAAETLVRKPESWREIREGCEGWGLSLLGPDEKSSAQTRRWLGWVSDGRTRLRRGFATAGELEDFLKHHGSPDGEDPWMTFDEVLLPPIGATVATLSRSSKGASGAVSEVAAALRHAGQDQPVLAALSASPTKNRVWRRQLDLRLPLVALGLHLAAMGTPTVQQRKAWAQLLMEEDPTFSALLEHPAMARQVVPDLAFPLAQDQQQLCHVLFDGLARVEGGLAAAFSHLQESHRGNAHAVLAMRRCCSVVGETELVGKVDREILVPGLAADGELRGRITAQTLESWLASMEPGTLAAALAGWRGRPYEQALAQVGKWTAEDPALAHRTAMDLADLEPGPLPKSDRLVPVIQALQAIEVPTRGLAPFLLTAVTDPEVTEEIDPILAKVEVVPGDDESSRRILETLHDEAVEDTVTTRLRELVEKLVVCPERVPEDVSRALYKVIQADFRSNPAEWVRWAGFVASCAERLSQFGAGQKGLARDLCRDWCIRAASMSWKSFPPEGVTLFERLAVADRPKVFGCWSRRVRKLGEKPGERELLTALRSLAASSDKLFSFDLAHIQGELERGELRLAQALNDLDFLAEEAGQTDSFFQVRHRLLPDDSTTQNKALLDLLLGQEISPRVRLGLHLGYLKQLARAVYRNGRLACNLARLAQDDRLLLAVAREVGKQARSDLPSAGRILCHSLREERFDAAEAILAGAGTQRREILRSLPDMDQEGILASRLQDPRGAVVRWLFQTNQAQTRQTSSPRRPS